MMRQKEHTITEEDVGSKAYNYAYVKELEDLVEGCSARNASDHDRIAELESEIKADTHCARIQMDGLIALRSEAHRFLEELSIEADEDSCMGMAFVTNRISEDWYYSLMNKLGSKPIECKHTIGTSVDEDGCCSSCGEDLNYLAFGERIRKQNESCEHSTIINKERP